MAEHTMAQAIQSILASEGYNDGKRGWVNDPADSGGPTIAGITWKSFCTFYGMEINPALCQDPNFLAQMQNMTEEHIMLFYRQQKLDAIRFADLPPGIDIALADAATLHGRGQAVKFLQRALGIKDDGIIGSQTCMAAQEHPDWDAVIQSMADQRRRFFENLVERRPKDKKFLKGWLVRNNRVAAEAMALAPGPEERGGATTGSIEDAGRPIQEEGEDASFWGTWG